MMRINCSLHYLLLLVVFQLSISFMNNIHPISFEIRLKEGTNSDNDINNIVDSIQDFKDIKQIPEWLLKSCEKLGFHHPTEVQKTSLPVDCKVNK